MCVYDNYQKGNGSKRELKQKTPSFRNGTKTFKILVVQKGTGNRNPNFE